MAERAQVSIKKPEAKRENKASQTQKAGTSQSISSPVEQILFLQRTIGNQAVGRLIKSGALQAKLRIGQPGDIYEQEADRVVEQVMWMPEPQVSKETKVSSHTQNNLIQRRCTKCIKGHQPKKEEEKEQLRVKNLNMSRIQHFCGTCKEKLQLRGSQATSRKNEPIIQAERSCTSASLSSHMLTKIRSPGIGSPLPSTVRERMEPVLGAELGHVSVHNDSSANATAQSLHAKAFTHKNHIWLGVNQSPNDVQLMAHELTHVVQQTEDTYGKSGRSSETGSVTAVDEGQIQRQKLPSWKNVGSAGEAAADWLTTTTGLTALENARALAELFGCSVTIGKGCLMITCPEIPLFASFQKTLGETPPAGFFIPLLMGGMMIGPFPVASMFGILGYAQGSVEAAVGPGVLRGIRFEICPSSGRYLSTAQLYAAAAIGLRITLFGGLFAAAGTLIPTEPPIPVIAIIQGGLRGTGTGWFIGAV